MITIQGYKSVQCAVCEKEQTTQTLEVETVRGIQRSIPACIGCRIAVSNKVAEGHIVTLTYNEETLHINKILTGWAAKQVQQLPPLEKVKKEGKSTQRVKHETLELDPSLLGE